MIYSVSPKCPFRILCTVFMIFVFSPHTNLEAQTQQGIVKTRGRMTATGSVIPGTRLGGATVNVRNISSVVSSNKGTFSFAMQSNSFYLTGVQKQGYMLCDNDILNKSHQYSANPFVVVMETPDNTSADRLAAERKIRRTLSRLVQAKEDELEAQKEQQKITESEYNKKLQELYALQKQNDNLIEDMARRYSTIDFDEMDEFQRQIAYYIQNGELMRADSLLNTKGSMDARSAELDRMDAAIRSDAAELSRRQAAHAKSVKMKEKALEDFAADCYSRFEICKLQHKNDSAAYWLELRASKDTINGAWQIECGAYILNYLANYTLARTYMERVLNIVTSDPDYSDEVRGASYANVADVYLKCGRYNDAINMYSKALSLHEKKSEGFIAATVGLANCYESIDEFTKAIEYLREAYSVYQEMGYQSPKLLLRMCNQLTANLAQTGGFDEAQSFLALSIDLAENNDAISQPEQLTVYFDAASLFGRLNMFEKSEALYNNALKVCQLIYDDKHPTLSSIYNGLGVLYSNLADYDKSLDYFLKANNVNSERQNSNSYAQTCSNIAFIYLQKGMLDLAEQYETEAYSIRKKIFGNDSPAMFDQYNALCDLYCAKGEYEKALGFVEKAIAVRKAEAGEIHPSLSASYSFVGGINMRLGRLDEALKWFKLALDITKHYYGNEHSKTADAYSNVGGVCLYLKRYDEAINMLTESLRIHHAVYGENHVSVASDYNGLAQTYLALEHYEDALVNFNKAIEIRKNVYGSNSAKLKPLYEFMIQIYKNLGSTEEMEYYETLLGELQN